MGDGNVPASAQATPLAGLLSTHGTHQSGPYGGASHTYLGPTTSKGKVGTYSSTSSCSVLCRCHYRLNDRDRLHVYSNTRGPRIPLPVELEMQDRATAHELLAKAGASQSISPRVVEFELSAVLAVLMSALAFYVEYDELGWDILTDGKPVVVESLERETDATVLSEVDMFIPYVSAGETGGAKVWEVIVAVCCGLGVSVFTVDAPCDSEYHAVVDEVSGNACAGACVQAILYIGGMYARSKATCVWINALTYGVHNSMTVVGHTEEESMMCHVWRTCRFSIPNSVVVFGSKAVGLCEPLVCSRNSIRCFVDAIALYTAAASAQQDPGEWHGGRIFPTMLAHGPKGADGRDGVTRAQIHAFDRECGDALKYSSVGAYCAKQAAVFDAMVATTSSQEARTMIHCFRGSQFHEFVDKNGRHTHSQYRHPFYWIENTGLVGHELDELTSVKTALPQAYLSYSLYGVLSFD